MSKLIVKVDYIHLGQWLNMIKFFLDHDGWEEKKKSIHLYIDRISNELEHAKREREDEASKPVGVSEE